MTFHAWVRRYSKFMGYPDFADDWLADAKSDPKLPHGSDLAVFEVHMTRFGDKPLAAMQAAYKIWETQQSGRTPSSTPVRH
jgi:hypothetical protein